MHRQRKVLVAYASRHGSTAEIAQIMAEALHHDNVIAEAKWVGHVTDIDEYDAIIIGSAIRYDKWLPEATEFVVRHQSALQQTPVFLFFTCMTLSVKSEKATVQAAEYAAKIAALLPQVSATDVGQFAGALDFDKIPFPGRLIARLIFVFLRVKQGDYRDWAAIRHWAETRIINSKTNPQPIRKGSSQ